MNKKLIFITLVSLLQSCNKVDDYMLGKDNTPKPTALAEITPKVNLVENWSAPVAKPSKASAYLKLKPVVVGQTVYTADTSGMVQAIDKNSGRLIWTTQLKEGVLSGPTVKQGYVAVGTRDAHVILLKESDGKQLWQADVSSDALSKPVITNQKVIVKTIAGVLYAFNLKNGEKVWASDHGSPSLILKASSSPKVMGNLVLVGFSDGRLDAIDIQTGNVVWQRSIAYANGASDVERLVDIDADPIIRGDIVYLASYQGYVGALSLKDGEFIWRKPASSYKNMAIDANTLYMTDADDVVWAFNRQTGQVKWKQVSLKARGLTEPVLMGSRLIVGDKTGYLHGLSTQTGDLIARTQLSAPVDISPTVSGSSVYVMTTNGKLNRLSVS